MNITTVRSATPAWARVVRSWPIIRSIACTDWARNRNSWSSRSFCAVVSFGLPASHTVPAGARSHAGVRGARSPGKRFASRGAGVYGWCGVYVDTSTRNG
nr:hypothetical protein [Actinoplanes xinjiangensis]